MYLTKPQRPKCLEVIKVGDHSNALKNHHFLGEIARFVRNNLNNLGIALNDDHTLREFSSIEQARVFANGQTQQNILWSLEKEVLSIAGSVATEFAYGTGKQLRDACTRFAASYNNNNTVAESGAAFQQLSSVNTCGCLYPVKQLLARTHKCGDSLIPKLVAALDGPRERLHEAMSSAETPLMVQSIESKSDMENKPVSISSTDPQSVKLPTDSYEELDLSLEELKIEVITPTPHEEEGPVLPIVEAPLEQKEPTPVPEITIMEIEPISLNVREICAPSETGTSHSVDFDLSFAAGDGKQLDHLDTTSVPSIGTPSAPPTPRTAKFDPRTRQSARDTISPSMRMITNALRGIGLSKPAAPRVVRTPVMQGDKYDEAPRTFVSDEEIGASFVDLLQEVAKHEWEMPKLQAVFLGNLSKAHKFIGEMLRDQLFVDLMGVNAALENQMKENNVLTAPRAAKCWALILICHSKIVRLLIYMAQSLDELPASSTPVLRMATSKLLGSAPGKTIRNLLRSSLKALTQACKTRQLSAFVKKFFVDYHRIAVYITLLRLEESFSRFAAQARRCVRIDLSEGEALALGRRAAQLFKATELTVAENYADFYRDICTMLASRPELANEDIPMFAFTASIEL
ncbi:unnamed protein product, partial [Mesorhabditis spiculigera]